MASSESLFQDSNDRIEFSELLHVHAGLRWELTLLYEKSLLLVKSIGTGGSKELQWKNNLSTFLKQFDFFFVIFHSHSKAEDDIIMPALTNRAAISMGKIPEELSHEHDGHHQFFDNIRLHLLPLRNEGAMNLSGEKSEGLRSLVEHVALLIEKLRSVVMLHFRKEEEELLPLLVTHFTKEELIELVGKIIGA
uniref:Hemerythrin-like domain-containing protein n=1 Tax=Aplanochytrium stocchinoi TaxID=215587 RepID=A0A7S3V2D2_9STRA